MPLFPEDKYEAFLEVKSDSSNNDVVSTIILAYTLTITAIIHQIDDK